MKKNLVITFCLILLLALPDITLASPPAETSFVITGTTVNPGEVTYPGSVAQIKGLEAQGDVEGALVGTFHYIENATVNLTTGWGTNQGFMTITTTSPCTGTIDIRFEGRTQINPAEGVAIIADQPFTILKGAGGCEGIHGQGTRSAVVSLFDPTFTVTYTAQVHWDPQ